MDQESMIPIESVAACFGLLLLFCVKFRVKAVLEAMPPNIPVTPIPFPGPMSLTKIYPIKLIPDNMTTKSPITKGLNTSKFSGP